jgi:hypothetical protein
MRTTHRRITLTRGWPVVLALTAVVLFGTGADCDDELRSPADAAATSAAGRSHYFYGRLLSADDLSREQDYDFDD